MDKNNVLIITLSILFGSIAYYFFEYTFVSIFLAYVISIVDSILQKQWKHSLFWFLFSLFFVFMSITWGQVNSDNFQKFSIAIFLAISVGALPSLVKHFKSRRVCSRTTTK